MPISVPSELITQVQALERDMSAAQKEAVQAAAEEKKLQAQAQEHRAAMRFWDRNFWGWFGNKEKIRRHRELRSLTAEFNAKAAKFESQASGLDAQIDRDIEAYLRKNDLSYQLLLAPHQAGVDMKSAAGIFLGKIDGAISSVGSAQTSELFDLFTSSAVVSVWSAFDSSSAKNAIDSVKSAAPDFQKAVETYNAALSSFKAANVQVTGIDDTIDLVFDLALGGFDFMSLFNLSALNDAKSDLKGLRDQVCNVENTVADHVSKTGAAVKAYKKQARLACRAPL